MEVKERGSRIELAEPLNCDVGLTPGKGEREGRKTVQEEPEMRGREPQHSSKKSSAGPTGAPEQRLSIGGVPGWTEMAQAASL